jgi:hypothetical protein
VERETQPRPTTQINTPLKNPKRNSTHKLLFQNLSPSGLGIESKEMKKFERHLARVDTG